MMNKKYSDLTTAQKVIGDDILQRTRPLFDDQNVKVVETSTQIRQRIADELLYQYVRQVYLNEKNQADQTIRSNEI